MRNGMSKDFSWSASAREYGKIYEKVRLMRASSAAPEKSMVSVP
jgi:glycogen synthase